MKINNKIKVVLGGDDQYAMPITVAIYSILKNIKKDSSIIFYILDGGFRDENKDRLMKVVQTQSEINNCKIKWLKPDIAKIEHLTVAKGFNSTVYLRLLIPDLLPNDLNKVIYLDGDVIVEKDINNLWNITIDAYALGAVQNVTIPYVSHMLGIEKYTELGLKPNTPYFNSGVLLINLERWRSESVSEIAMEYVIKYKKFLHLNEQEALNAVVGGKWKKLNSRWNQQPNIFYFSDFANFNYNKIIQSDYKKLINDPHIIHYCERKKPWQFNCTHPSQDKFIKYLKESGWFSEADFTDYIEEMYSKRLNWMFRNSKNALNQIKHFLP